MNFKYNSNIIINFGFDKEIQKNFEINLWVKIDDKNFNKNLLN